MMMEKMEKITSPLKAIKAKCLDCCCGQANEVKLCTCKDCPLFEFRFGKNPYYKSTKRNLTDEEREKLRERLAKAREAKFNH